KCQMHWDTVHMPRMLSAIGLSTKSIRTLRIDLGSIHNTGCVDFIEHLKTVGTVLTLEKLTLTTTSLDNDYWQSSVLTDQHSALSPPTPPELFSQFSSLRHLTIEKPTWQPSIVFDQELAVYRFQPGPVFKSVWSQDEATDLWRTRCPGLLSVKVYGRMLVISSQISHIRN
ncbi:unnamed protein product, partial [Rhizoctonia solani]